LRCFGDGPCDLVFLDMKLPGINGAQVLVELKHRHPGVQVIVMTGYSLRELLDQARREGAWRILVKPFDMDKVLAMVDNLQKGAVLVVDDDPDFIASMREILASRGFPVLTAGSGREALDRVREGNARCIVLDLRMPDMDGYATLLALRQQGYDLPIMVVTAYPDEEAETLARVQAMMGVDSVLTKPFEPRAVLARMEALCARTPERKGG
ncbi:response regulator, partial [bacterium]